MDKTKKIIIETMLKDGASKGLKDMGGSMDGVSKKSDLMAKAATVAKIAVAALAAVVVGAGIAAFKAGQNFEEARSNIVKLTGASGDALVGMMETVKQVSRNVPQDLKAVSDAVGTVQTRLGLTGEELETSSKMFLDFSRVSKMEVEPAIRGVSRFMNDWGIEAKDTNKILDQMTAVSQATGVSIEQLTTTGVNYGVQLRALGFSQEAAIALMGKWEKEGVSTEKMVGGLSIALGRLAKAGMDDTAEAFHEIIKGMKDIDSVGEVTREAIELLGMRAGPDFALAVKEGRFEFEDYLALIEGSEGTLASAAEASLTLGDRWSMLKNRVNALLEPIGTFLVESLGKAMTKFGEWGDAVMESETFQTLKTWVEETGTAIGEFAEDKLELLKTKWGEWRESFNEWWDSDSRKGITEWFGDIKEAIDPFIKLILPLFIFLWDFLVELWTTWVSPALDELKDSFLALLESLGLDDLEQLKKIVLVLLGLAILPFLAAVMALAAFLAILVGVITVVLRVVSFLVKAIIGLWEWGKKINARIGKLASTFWKWFDPLNQIWQTLKNIMTVDLGKVGEFLSGGRRQSGGNVMQSGMYKVGEFGPEKVYLPQGSRVVNASDTARESSGQQVVINNTFAQTDMDVDTLAQKLSFQLKYL